MPYAGSESDTERQLNLSCKAKSRHAPLLKGRGNYKATKQLISNLKLIRKMS